MKKINGFLEQIAINTIILNNSENTLKKRKITIYERLNASKTARKYRKELEKAKRWLEICFQK